MAEHLSAAGSTVFEQSAQRMGGTKGKLSVALLILLGWVGTANAENLPDPTRPPPQAMSLPAGSAVSAAGPQLQSILIGPGRKTAIISGQSVSLGEKVGDAVVVKIADGEVVLRNGSDLQTLKLFPGIEKRAMADRPASRPESRGQQR
ncbi:hypothetical protein BH11PSE11_BH11PSE11_11320 [soil metagenome]